VAERLPALVRHEVLLGDIGDIFGVGILRQEVIVRLLLHRTDIFRDRQPPLVTVGEFRVDVEDDPAEGIPTMTDDLTD